MQRKVCLSLASLLLAAILPAGAGAYSNLYPGSLRIETGMTAESYYVHVHLAGLRPEDIEVRVRCGRLLLESARYHEHSRQTPDARSVSRLQLHFRELLWLPYDADWTRMTTHTQGGIMTISIPRRQQVLPPYPPAWR